MPGARNRSFGSFSRSFQVPEGVSEADITADLSDGVLNVTVKKPKPKEAPKKIKIDVKASK